MSTGRKWIRGCWHTALGLAIFVVAFLSDSVDSWAAPSLHKPADSSSGALDAAASTTSRGGAHSSWGIFATHRIPLPNIPEAHRPLNEFPAAFAIWHSEDFPYEADVVEAIGADDYINRLYSGSTPPIELLTLGITKISARATGFIPRRIAASRQRMGTGAFRTGSKLGPQAAVPCL